MDAFAPLRNTAVSLEAALTSSGFKFRSPSGFKGRGQGEYAGSLKVLARDVTAYAWEMVPQFNSGIFDAANVTYIQVLHNLLTAGYADVEQFEGDFDGELSYEAVAQYFTDSTANVPVRGYVPALLVQGLQRLYPNALFVTADQATPGAVPDGSNQDQFVRPATREDIQKATSQVTF